MARGRGTTLAGAMADKSNLPPYQGCEVTSTKVAVRNTGDGLSEGLSIDPVVYPVGSTQYVVIECEVTAHNHQRDNDAPVTFTLEQVFRGGAGIVVDRDLVSELIDAQKDRIQAAKDEAAGRLRLGDDAETGEPAAEDVTELATRRTRKRKDADAEA